MDIQRLLFYTLDENKMPVPCDNPMEWHIWYDFADKHVAKDWVGPVMVSTVFLGLDFGFGLWETMVLGGRMDRYQARSDGRLAEALKMHERILELVKLAEEVIQRDACLLNPSGRDPQPRELSGDRRNEREKDQLREAITSNQPSGLDGLFQKIERFIKLWPMSAK